MKDKKPDGEASVATASPAFRLQLPGFIREEEIGLGDVISRIGYAAGITPCGGCRERAQRLNRWIVFTR
jgi:hypothetical protein